MDALENVLLDGAGKRVVVAEEESLGEIDHVEETQTMILEVVFLALEREEGFELVFGGGLDFERNYFGVSDGVDHMTHDDSFGFGFGDNHQIIATNESDKA